MPEIFCVVVSAASSGTPLSIAKWLVAAVAVWNYGGVIADAIVPVTAKQHLWNPRWPPHAKFHNCQTMVMGLMLGSFSLWELFGTGQLTPSRLAVAAATAGAYFVSMLFAPLFPGTAWHDPEFADLDPMPLGMSTQKLLAIALSGVLLVAVLLARAS